MPFPNFSLRARGSFVLIVFVSVLALFSTPNAKLAAAQESEIPAAARLAYEQGESALQTGGKAAESVNHFKKAIELHADYEAAHLQLGEAYFKLKRYTEAGEPLEKVVALNPGNGRAQTMLGIVYKLQGEHGKAVDALAEAVRIDPGNFDAQFELSFAYMRRDRDFESAETHARAAHELRKDLRKVHVLLYTVAAARALDFRLIEEELLHILEISPTGPAADRTRVLLEEIHGRLRAQGKTPREVPKPPQSPEP